MSDLISLNHSEMRDGLVAKKFSVRGLVTAHLTRIEKSNETLNSFVTVAQDQALIQADAAQRVIDEQGKNAPRMCGIPVAVKDMIVTKDLRTTAASRMLENYVSPFDATVVARLKQRHAVIVGKTNLDEFAMGASNENSYFGAVRNPWDLSRVPGGSSGGSAVAVATGQAVAALGTDTGGSIRQPASLTGVVGLRPTYGRVSRYGAIAFASSLDQIGAFGRTVGDVAATMEIISGVDENDATSMAVDVPSYSEHLAQLPENYLQGKRIGVPKEYFIDGMEKEVEVSVRAAIAELGRLGAEIVEISLPHTEHALAAYYIINPAEASSNLARYDGVRFGHRAAEFKNLTEMYENTRAEGFGGEVRRRILIGTYVLSAGYYDAYYRKAQQIRTLIINDFKAAFANSCDLVAAPVSPTTAFKIGEKAESPLQMYLADVFTVPVNLAGLPGLSVPCGFDSQNLPIGLQLIGPPFSEDRLMEVGECFSRSNKFDTRAMTKKQFNGAN